MIISQNQSAKYIFWMNYDSFNNSNNLSSKENDRSHVNTTWWKAEKQNLNRNMLFRIRLRTVLVRPRLGHITNPLHGLVAAFLLDFQKPNLQTRTCEHRYLGKFQVYIKFWFWHILNLNFWNIFFVWKSMKFDDFWWKFATWKSMEMGSRWLNLFSIEAAHSTSAKRDTSWPKK